MTALEIGNPNETDTHNLQPGDVVRINGTRTAYRVEGVAKFSVLLVGPRGGVAHLVASTNGKRVQLSRGLGTSNKRDWIDSLTIERG